MGTEAERERIREKADRICVLVAFVGIVSAGIGVALMVYSVRGCSGGDSQCLAHPYRGDGVALIAIAVLFGLLTWLASTVLDAVLDRSDGPVTPD